MGWGCGGGQVEFKGLGWGCRDWRALWKMCCGKVGFGGGPGGVEKAVEAGMDLAAGGELWRGEEVQLLAGAGAGDIEETLALCGLAVAVNSVEPVVERLRRLSTTRDGREHEVGRAVGGRVGRFEFGPGEQAGAVCRGLAFEGGDEDDVPLQTLGLVDGEEFDERLAGRDGSWFGEEPVEVSLQESEIEEAGG